MMTILIIILGFIAFLMYKNYNNNLAVIRTEQDERELEIAKASMTLIYEKAKFLLEKGEHILAMQCCKSLLEIDPNNEDFKRLKNQILFGASKDRIDKKVSDFLKYKE